MARCDSRYSKQVRCEGKAGHAGLHGHSFYARYWGDDYQSGGPFPPPSTVRDVRAYDAATRSRYALPDPASSIRPDGPDGATSGVWLHRDPRAETEPHADCTACARRGGGPGRHPAAWDGQTLDAGPDYDGHPICTVCDHLVVRAGSDLHRDAIDAVAFYAPDDYTDAMEVWKSYRTAADAAEEAYAEVRDAGGINID